MIRLLDTNICIYIINQRKPEVLKHFAKYQPGDLSVSFITAAELRYGAAKSQNSQKTNAALDHFLAPFDVLPLDENVTQTYAHLRATLEKSGTPIGPLDTFIAAHARHLSATLVTNNVREFSRVADLLLENWVE